MITLQSAERWAELTATYQPDGAFAWTIDSNSYGTIPELYRGQNPWIAFALFDSGAPLFDGGPACLTMFLDGPHTGNVFYLAPEPGFNILRPIARDFHDLLNRINADVAAFLRLCRVHGTFAGPNGGFFALDPLEYVDDARGHPEFSRSDPHD